MEPSSSEYQAFTDEELKNLWNDTTDFEVRDKLVAELQRRDLFPSSGLREWEYDTGAYPDVLDPEFLQKLLAKREFAESLQSTWKPKTNPCGDDDAFEVTPVQRFVANFMSPKTPYMSMLLYHGVGVGKTCAAIQITEAWLDIFPRQEVYIVAPPTIQDGFYRTIFDITRVTIGEGNDPNSASQCTGDKYMRLTNTLYERDPIRLQKLVMKMIRRRYKVFGYISFANYIRDKLKTIPDGVSDEVKQQFKKDLIRKYFSGRLLIVDEAHNLRDLAEEIAEEEGELPGGKAEKSDAAGGKILTPYLRDVLQYSEGLKFAMLTATPMYNTYREIIFILNLLLLNDKKATIVESDVFDKAGQITEKGSKLLSMAARNYISFMRGENPISFPIRLFPQNIEMISAYPENNPRGVAVPEEDKVYYNQLPLVPITLTGDVLSASLAFMNALPPGKGLSTVALAKLVHAGNFIVPATESTEGDTLEAYTRRVESKTAMSTIFGREYVGGEARYKAKKEGGAKWLSYESIEPYSPKFKFLLNRVNKCDGCVFVYTRFVEFGALPLALFLEANGYTPYGRKTTLLANGIQSIGGRQCALCPSREKNHSMADHAFTPAYYGLLTGDILLSPRNEDTIKAQRAMENATGVNMKVIIGSQIASEGVDLRFVRETHVLDSWFHLNKTEQILGRAIRFRSHCALSAEKRNTTVYLYTSVLPSNYNRETADMYSYRIGFKKAVQVGRVTRILKQSAIDCNLNKDAIVIQGQQPVKQLDSQGTLRQAVNINDMPFTAVCDWIETCDYKCTPEVTMRDLKPDDSTYDEFSARWRITQMKKTLQNLFSLQSFYRSDDLWHNLSDVPRMVAIDLLTDIVDNPAFQVSYQGKMGYIRYCNGYYIFQPNIYVDLTIPLAIRAAKFPVKRDSFIPQEFDIPEEIIPEEEVVDTTLTIESIWSRISDWVTEISTRDSFPDIPDEVNQRIRDMSKDDIEIYNKYRQVIEMFEWFQTSYINSADKNSDAFHLILLQYIWDHWLTLDEQRFLTYSTELELNNLISSAQYRFGKTLVNRFLDVKDGDILYLCGGGEVCKAAVIDEVLKSRDDPLKAKKISVDTTGELYGFNAPKYGEMVFKINQPPTLIGKLGSGKECANVSTMTGHINTLVALGEILDNSGMDDFDLRREVIVATRKIKNSNRACTLIELILRYMDAIHLHDKRWFYRPVEAYYAGHKGSIRPGKK